MSWLITGSQKVNWDPSLITSSLWLDAADVSTVTTVSGGVSQWNDKSGNGRNATQATSALRPTVNSTGINSKPTINFNGSGLLLSVPRGFITNAVSAFAVYSGGGVNARILDQRSTGLVGAVKGWQVKNRNSATSDLCIVDDGAGNARMVSDLDGLDGSSKQIAFVFPANTNPRQYINGAEYGTLQLTGGIPTDIDNATFNITIGGNAGGGTTQDFTGLIGEVILLNSGASTNTRQRIEGYLAHKWGLTANLPSDHPYKVNVPTP
jgi:hypothetical protein